MNDPTLAVRAAAEAELRRRRREQVDALYDTDPVRWIETHFYIPETNAPIVLMPYQRDVLRYALERGADGLFRYSTVLWGDLKKSAKSSIAGAVALWFAWHNPYDTVRVVANDLKQADSRTFYYIRRAIQLHPQLRRMCRMVRYHIELPNNTVINAVPVDPKGEAGGGDCFICFTELWAAKNTAAQQMWSETTLSPLKFGRSIRWAETYAGFVGESPVLEQLYDMGVKQGRVVNADLELTDNGRLLALWNTRPRCTWQTPEYYAQEEQAMPPSEFLRLHRNVWAMASNPFVPLEWWNACAYRADDPTEFPAHKPLVLALDAGVSDDLFAVVGVSRHAGKVYVRYVKTYAAPPGGKINFEEVETDILAICARHSVECITYDPYQLESTAQRLAQSGRVYMREFGQGAPRAIADKLLYDAIRERRVIHGNDPTLNEHVINANVEVSERLMRIVKRNPSQKIDALVALSMAHAVAVELEM